MQFWDRLKCCCSSFEGEQETCNEAEDSSCLKRQLNYKLDLTISRINKKKYFKKKNFKIFLNL